MGRSGQQPYLDGIEHEAQVRRIDHTLRTALGEHDRPLRPPAAIGELKAKPAGELQVHGSGRLVRWLFDNHLVDEIILLTYPVVIGEGTRLFPDTGRDIALDLVDSRVTRGGTIQVYGPPGARSMQPPPCDIGAAVRESRHPEATSAKLNPDS